MTELTCHEVIDFLAAYLDDELPPDVRACFEEHLGVCPPCVDYIATYRQTQALALRAAQDEASDDEAAPEPLVQAILAAWTRRTDEG